MSLLAGLVEGGGAEGGGVSGELSVSLSNSLEGGWSAEGNTTLGLGSKHSASGTCHARVLEGVNSSKSAFKGDLDF